MTIKEIDGNVFGEFASNHMLKNYFQTKEYGDLMKYSDFSVMYIGAFQNNILIGLLYCGLFISVSLVLGRFIMIFTDLILNKITNFIPYNNT